MDQEGIHFKEFKILSKLELEQGLPHSRDVSTTNPWRTKGTKAPQFVSYSRSEIFGLYKGGLSFYPTPVVAKLSNYLPIKIASNY